jgi:phospholipase/carboxylesterase
MDGAMERRRFLAAVAGATMACGGTHGAARGADAARLRARPAPSPSEPIQPGEHRLGLGDARDGMLYVPRERPAAAPLLVLLHGAGGAAQRITSRLEVFALADRAGAAVLAPDSRGGTWDVVRGGFGPDVAFIDKALGHTFSRVAVDRRRVAIGGFSDGASYALALGLVNGDLFTHILAFSPGFLSADEPRGQPAIFVSHGTDDQILPIDRTSRRLVPILKRAGYDVRYREFNGPHTVPSSIAREAFDWWVPPARSDRD